MLFAAVVDRTSFLFLLFLIAAVIVVVTAANVVVSSRCFVAFAVAAVF